MPCDSGWNNKVNAWKKVAIESILGKETYSTKKRKRYIQKSVRRVPSKSFDFSGYSREDNIKIAMVVLLSFLFISCKSSCSTIYVILVLFNCMVRHHIDWKRKIKSTLKKKEWKPRNFSFLLNILWIWTYVTRLQSDWWLIKTPKWSWQKYIC